MNAMGLYKSFIDWLIPENTNEHQIASVVDGNGQTTMQNDRGDEANLSIHVT